MAPLLFNSILAAILELTEVQWRFSDSKRRCRRGHEGAEEDEDEEEEGEAGSQVFDPTSPSGAGGRGSHSGLEVNVGWSEAPGNKKDFELTTALQPATDL